MAKEIRFIPAYYEWHLVDENGKVLYNLVDPWGWGDPLDDCKTLQDVIDVMEEDINVEKMNWNCCGGEPESPHNSLVNPFTLPDNAAEVMAQALYDYYVA